MYTSKQYARAVYDVNHPEQANRSRLEAYVKSETYRINVVTVTCIVLVLVYVAYAMLAYAH